MIHNGYAKVILLHEKHNSLVVLANLLMHYTEGILYLLLSENGTCSQHKTCLSALHTVLAPKLNKTITITLQNTSFGDKITYPFIITFVCLNTAYSY